MKFDIKHHSQRFIYKIFRLLKLHYISSKVRPDTHLFFYLVHLADKILSPRKRPSQELYKVLYLTRFGNAPLFKLDTEKPIALDSDDHIWPRGTIADNSSNYKFNLKLYNFFRFRHDLKLLDLGCSGGGLVRSIIDDGYMAIGIEGSDISKKLRSAEWDTCIHHLFTADITTTFRLTNTKGMNLYFQCISAWEVLEHISQDKLPVLFSNIYNHLADDGIFVGSIDMTPDGNPITGAIYHQTLKPEVWWLEQFKQAGLEPVSINPFERLDYVRGHGQGLKDWDANEKEGFHVVLKKVN